MSTTTAETDERAIRDLAALAQESQSDPEALMALHTADTAIVNLAGRRVLGREAYAKAMADALASPLSDVLTTAEIVDIRLATPDVAIVSCTKTVHDGRSGADESTALPSTGASPTSPSETPTVGASPSPRQHRSSRRQRPMSEPALAPRPTPLIAVDLIGAGICLAGVTVIMYSPR